MFSFFNISEVLMVKLQEERKFSRATRNKSKSTNRFKSIFLQCKKIINPCQEKNSISIKFFLQRLTGAKKESIPAPLVIEDRGKVLIRLDSRNHGNGGNENSGISSARIRG